MRSNEGGYLSTREAAALLGLSPATLAKWRARRAGPPFVKLGRRIAYRPKVVEAWAEAHEVKPGAEPGGHDERARL